jgi:hypothetical protein
MPDRAITVTIPHRLTQDEARQRLQDGIAKLRTQFGGQATAIQETWTDNQLDFRLTAMGQTVTGRIDVMPSAVKLEVNLPWLLAAFANKIRPQIEQQGRKMLES